MDEVTTDLYADDTTLYYTGKSILEIKTKLQNSLISLHRWCKGNGMVLNTHAYNHTAEKNSS